MQHEGMAPWSDFTDVAFNQYECGTAQKVFQPTVQQNPGTVTCNNDTIVALIAN